MRLQKVLTKELVKSSLRRMSLKHVSQLEVFKETTESNWLQTQDQSSKGQSTFMT